jgi:hypothetical protein
MPTTGRRKCVTTADTAPLSKQIRNLRALVAEARNAVLDRGEK